MFMGDKVSLLTVCSIAEQFQSHLDFLVVVNDLLSEKECDSLIELSQKSGFVQKEISGAFEGSNSHTVRNGLSFNRASFENKALANALWKRIAEHSPKEIDDYVAVGLNERLRFYRYTEGQHFGAHTDGYFQRDNGEKSFLTLMIYLNDDFTGGETLFLKRERLIAPKTGMALIFTHRQWHAGLAVKEGCKYILRTDVMFQLAQILAGKTLNPNINRPRFMAVHGAMRNQDFLTHKQVKEIKDYAVKLGMPRDHIFYSENMNTSWSPNFDLDTLYIGLDVLPAKKLVGRTLPVNSYLSWKASVAHEVIGHRQAYLDGKSHEGIANDWLEEAQASVRAALLTPNLTSRERRMLIRDARDRLKNKDNKLKFKDVRHLLWLEPYQK
jgi:hypothetical protein